MKQETLEEAAENYSERHQDVSGNLGKYLVSAVFIDGAEWQQQKSYSEEDMNRYADYVLMCSAEKTFKLPLHPKEWFEQFKKK